MQPLAVFDLERAYEDVRERNVRYNSQGERR
jgi:hypothetical protein